MSATLDAAPIAAYLGGARILRSEGRHFPLEIEYTPHSAAPLEQQVAGALDRLRDAPGHVLVFLPGAFEIRRAQTACAALANRHGWTLLPLHGDQPPEEQDRAVAPSDRRKIILSTNVAESSVTIEDVGAVVDSGLARIAGHSPWSGLPTLQVGRISQASANQRAGRAGRTRPGRAVRLYPLDDFVRRPAQDVPEIARADLAPMLLQLRAMGLTSALTEPLPSGSGRTLAHTSDLAWLDPPPAASLDRAAALLAQLAPTADLAREMARYPLHPRLARLIVESRREGVAEDGCTVAALLSAGERLPARPHHATRSDLLVLMESEWEPRTSQIVRQIRRLVDPPRQRARDEDALLRSVLAAFPDRVARRRQGADLQLASGGPAQLAPSSTVTGAEFLVAVEAEDRRDRETPLVRIASAIEPAWLLDLFPGRIRETSEAQWNRQAGRVETVSALLFDDIVIEQSRRPADPETAATILAQKAIEAGLHKSADLDAFLARAAFAGIDALPIEPAMRILAAGARSLSDIDPAGLIRVLEHQLPPADRRRLEDLAPDRIRLPGGRQVRVHYEPDQPPWIASRLQDFYGMTATPTVGRGVPVVVRLLAPNNRLVQMTTDLPGFWQRLYPQLRKELSRRYPKHQWP
jgi:ATP-dependent helicase HrpB